MNTAPVLDRATILAMVQARNIEAGALAPKVDAARPGMRLVPAHEMLSEPVAPAWLVRGLLTTDALSVLFGESGSMKTFAALDIAVSVASGEPWQGLKVPNPGPVVYVAGEGFRGLSVRLQALVRHRGIDPHSLPLYFTSQAVQFLDPDDAESAMQTVSDLAEEHGAPRLVVIDTLARCYGPGDENNTSDMNRFVAALDALRKRFDCCVLVVHHTGLMNRDRSRGAGSLRAALDWEYRLEVQDDIRTISCTKSKDFEPMPQMHFEPQVVSTGWLDDTGREIGSIVLVPAENAPGQKVKPLPAKQRLALDALVDLYGAEPVHVRAWRELTYKRGICPSEDNDSKAKAFKRAASALLDAGLVQVDDDFYTPTGQTGQTGQKPDMSTLSSTGQDGRTGQPPLGGVCLSGPVEVSE